MKELDNRQSRYTPDPGTVEGPIHCGVCNTLMDVERNCYGPRGFAMAMSGSKAYYDEFMCPHHEDDWHKQAVALREAANSTPSSTLERLLLEEANDVIKSKKATKKVSCLL